MNRIIVNPDLRRWIYGIATAGLGVLLIYAVLVFSTRLTIFTFAVFATRFS